VSALAAMQPNSATPVVAVTVILLVGAVVGVLLVSWLFHWRSGRAERPIRGSALGSARVQSPSGPSQPGARSSRY